MIYLILLATITGMAGAIIIVNLISVMIRAWREKSLEVDQILAESAYRDSLRRDAWLRRN